MENKIQAVVFGVLAVSLLSMIGYAVFQWQYINESGSVSATAPRSDHADDVVEFMVQEYSAVLESADDVIFAHSMQQGPRRSIQNEACTTHPSSVAIFNAYSVALKQNIHSRLNNRMFALYKDSHPDQGVDMADMPVVMRSHGVVDLQGDEPTRPLSITFAWAPEPAELVTHDPPVIIFDVTYSQGALEISLNEAESRIEGMSMTELHEVYKAGSEDREEVLSECAIAASNLYAQFW